MTSIFKKFHDKWLQQQLRVGFCESCTAGMLTSMFARLPDASKYLIASMITYSNEAKEILVGVSPSVLHNYGAVSPETAEAMCTGLQQQLSLDIAISVTGIFGPTGGSKEKPIGTIYVSLYCQGVQKTLLLDIPHDKTRDFYFYRAPSMIMEQLRLYITL